MIRAEWLGGNENSLLLVALTMRQLGATVPFERVTELPMLAPVEVNLELLLSQRKVRGQPLDVAQEDLEHFREDAKLELIAPDYHEHQPPTALIPSPGHQGQGLTTAARPLGALIPDLARSLAYSSTDSRELPIRRVPRRGSLRELASE